MIDIEDCVEQEKHGERRCQGIVPSRANGCRGECVPQRVVVVSREACIEYVLSIDGRIGKRIQDNPQRRGCGTTRHLPRIPQGATQVMHDKECIENVVAQPVVGGGSGYNFSIRE